VWWISRHPALALLGATCLLSLVLFPSGALRGQEDNGGETSSAPTLVLNPQQIVITLTNELSQRPTSFDRAVEEIKEQIERRREAELEKASQGAFWRARFWDYLPKATGSGSLNSPVTDKGDDDPFFTPQYLTLSYRIVDRQLAESDARSRIFFGR
jgi:hypothetical protein